MSIILPIAWYHILSAFKAFRAPLYRRPPHWPVAFSANSTPTAYRSLSVQQSNFASAKAAIFNTCHTLASLGYTTGLSKFILVPSRKVPYPGFAVDSHLQAFTLLPRKKTEAPFPIQDYFGTLSGAPGNSSETCWEVSLDGLSSSWGSTIHHRDKHGHFNCTWFSIFLV